MGLGGISIWQLLIILVIVALIFGTKKLRSIGGDLGGAVKGFKSALKDENKDADAQEEDAETASSDAKKESQSSDTKS